MTITERNPKKHNPMKAKDVTRGEINSLFTIIRRKNGVSIRIALPFYHPEEHRIVDKKEAVRFALRLLWAVLRH